jgi:hypothetical protein
MHLMLLRIDPATMLMEAFLVSANTGKYTGAAGVLNSATPIQLFSVPMPQPISGSSKVSGAVTMRGGAMR